MAMLAARRRNIRSIALLNRRRCVQLKASNRILYLEDSIRDKQKKTASPPPARDFDPKDVQSFGQKVDEPNFNPYNLNWLDDLELIEKTPTIPSPVANESLATAAAQVPHRLSTDSLNKIKQM